MLLSRNAPVRVHQRGQEPADTSHAAEGMAYTFFKPLTFHEFPTSKPANYKTPTPASPHKMRSVLPCMPYVELSRHLLLHIKYLE